MRLGCYAFCLLLAAFAASAGNEPAKPSEANDPSKGWIMFSMTATGRYRQMAVPDLYYRGRNGVEGKVEAPQHKLHKDTGRLPQLQNWSSLVLTREDPVGAIKLLGLPPGEYEFYIGNLNFAFGDVGFVPQGRSLRIEVNDEIWRDVKLFRERFTDFEKIPVQSSLPVSTE